MESFAAVSPNRPKATHTDALRRVPTGSMRTRTPKKTCESPDQVDENRNLKWKTASAGGQGAEIFVTPGSASCRYDKTSDMPVLADRLNRNFHTDGAEQWELEDLLAKERALGELQKAATDKHNSALMDKLLLLDATAGDEKTTAPDISDSKESCFQDVDDEEDHDEEGGIGWRKLAKLVLPHVGLILLTCTYTLIGASVFYSLERPSEHKQKNQSLVQIRSARENMLSSLWSLAREANTTEIGWQAVGDEHLQNLSEALYQAFDLHYMTLTEIRDGHAHEIWNFSTSIFFAVTVVSLFTIVIDFDAKSIVFILKVTTIGYGNPVPLTFFGKLFCIFFALFGIPLTLVTIADVGKFFSEQLIWLYAHFTRLKHRVRDKWRHMRSDGKHTATLDDAGGTHICERCRAMEHDVSLLQHQDERKIPASLVMAILVSYTALGGVLLQHLEHDWSFFNSFYYSFITMTTVGFGDFVPQKSEKIFVILLYIIFGLAITTMCIDLVGVQYIRKIHYFGRKMQDAHTMLAIVGDKAVYLSEFYSSWLQRKYGLSKEQIAILPDGSLVIPNVHSRQWIPFIPRDIKRIQYIDEGTDSIPSSTASLQDACRHYCHHHGAAARSLTLSNPISVGHRVT